MRELRPSGSEGGARFKPLSLPLSGASPDPPPHVGGYVGGWGVRTVRGKG